MATKHNLEFFSAPWSNPLNFDGWQIFQVGTVHGQWRDAGDAYEILTIVNDKPGNGHLEDVLQWFEESCKRDNRNLRILELWNRKFGEHLVRKYGFLWMNGGHLIKYYAKRI